MKLLYLEVILPLGWKYPVSLLFGWDFESLLSICSFFYQFLLKIPAEMWCLSWTWQVIVRQPFWCYPAYGAVSPASFGPQASTLLHGWQYLGYSSRTPVCALQLHAAHWSHLLPMVQTPCKGKEGMPWMSSLDPTPILEEQQWVPNNRSFFSHNFCWSSSCPNRCFMQKEMRPRAIF